MKKIEAICFSGKDMPSSLYLHSSGDAEKLVSCYIKAPSDSHGLAHVFWFVCGYGDAGLLCARRLQPLVCPRLRLGLCSRIGVWLSSGRLALWCGRGDLVSRCLGPLAEKNPIVVFVRAELTAPMKHPIAEKIL